ncbi:MAG: hypothetical protein ACYTBR_05880, partial [Planctomycetota bacterium]
GRARGRGPGCAAGRQLAGPGRERRDRGADGSAEGVAARLLPLPCGCVRRTHHRWGVGDMREYYM